MGLLQIHQRPVHVQQKRGVERAAMHRNTASCLVIGQGDREQIHGANRRSMGLERTQGLLVGVLAVRRQNNELPDPPLFPRAHQVVEESMQRLASHRGAPGKGSAGGRVDTIFYGGGAQHVELGRKIVGEPFHDEGVAPQREMGPMLLGSAHGNDQAGVPREVGAHGRRSQVLD